MKPRIAFFVLAVSIALALAASQPSGPAPEVSPYPLSLASRTGAAPRFDAWRVIGPGGAGGMFLPTISPHDPNVVVEHCDMTGTYITLDGGESWRMFNLRSTASAIAFDSKTLGVIYVANSALWRSEDTGKTWSMVFPDPKKNTVEHMRGDCATPVFTTDDPAYPSGQHIWLIAVDPNDSNNIYLIFDRRSPVYSRVIQSASSSLYGSKDRGKTWSRMRDFPGEQIASVYVVPGSREVNVVGESGVYKMTGGKWEHLAAPAGGKVRFASAGMQNGKSLLYATTGDGLHVSEDGGRTWRTTKSLAAGAPASTFLNIVCSSNNAQTAYVGFHEDGRSGTARYYGVAKTTDGGRTWSIGYREANEPAINVEHSWVADLYGGAGPIRDIFVAPRDPNVVHVTDSCPRALRTTDGGRTWREEMAAFRGKDRWGRDKWKTTGFDVTTCYGMHFDPFEPKNMFIRYTDIGLFKSIDGGKSWMSSINGIPRRWFNTTYWVEFDPKDRGMMWGAFAETHDLPRPKLWLRADPDTFAGGIAWSRDGGNHWIEAQGLPETAVTHIILDPESPVKSRTLYATAFGKGVYKSTDNGKSWTLKNRGIEKKQPFAWRLSRANNGTLYLVVSRRSEGRIGDEEDGALYKSTDGAENWVKMTLPEGTNGPTGLTLDPVDNNRMYLSAWGVERPDGDTGGGVFLSTDAGATWKNIVSDSQHVYDVTVDPKNPNVVYHSGFDVGAWRSADRGATWKRIQGFNFKWGHRVVPDPFDASKVYITTFGGSVWHGPAEGDPNAKEDIITPVKIAK